MAASARLSLQAPRPCSQEQKSQGGEVEAVRLRRRWWQESAVPRCCLRLHLEVVVSAAVVNQMRSSQQCCVASELPWSCCCELAWSCSCAEAVAACPCGAEADTARRRRRLQVTTPCWSQPHCCCTAPAAVKRLHLGLMQCEAKAWLALVVLRPGEAARTCSSM